MQNWIRRYDRDVDMRLSYADFVKALSPYCQYTQHATDIKTPEKKPIANDGRSEIEPDRDSIAAVGAPVLESYKIKQKKPSKSLRAFD